MNLISYSLFYMINDKKRGIYQIFFLVFRHIMSNSINAKATGIIYTASVCHRFNKMPE